MPWSKAQNQPEISQPLRTNELLYVQDEKPAETDAGTFNSGSWQTRTLNTVVQNTISGASLSSNQVTLPAGTYFIEGSAPAIMVAYHKAILYNVTDSANALLGTSEYIDNRYPIQTISFITGIITISAPKTFEMRHRCTTSKVGDGFGVGTRNGFAVTEIYAKLFCWKLN